MASHRLFGSGYSVLRGEVDDEVQRLKSDATKSEATPITQSEIAERQFNNTIEEPGGRRP